VLRQRSQRAFQHKILTDQATDATHGSERAKRQDCVPRRSKTATSGRGVASDRIPLIRVFTECESVSALALVDLRMDAEAVAFDRPDVR
jgi:hypothetical protein